MPKSRIRNRNHPPMHYNPFANIITPEQRKLKFGIKPRPVPGSTHRINRISSRSPYMGSVINEENRRKYEQKEMELFKDRYISDIDKKRNDILTQKDKTEEEIDFEIKRFNSNQISEEELEYLAKRFARYQSNKEKKHYNAWLKGKHSFTYKKTTFPVLTEKFLKDTKSIKDIIKTDSNE